MQRKDGGNKEGKKVEKGRGNKERKKGGIRKERRMQRMERGIRKERRMQRKEEEE